MILNYTPHEVNVLTEAGALRYPSVGVARVAQRNAQIGAVDGIPLYRAEYGDVIGLPEPQKDTYYIVSALVKAAACRDDLLSPCEFVRDDGGAIIGCRGFLN